VSHPGTIHPSVPGWDGSAREAPHPSRDDRCRKSEDAPDLGADQRVATSDRDPGSCTDEGRTERDHGVGGEGRGTVENSRGAGRVPAGEHIDVGRGIRRHVSFRHVSFRHASFRGRAVTLVHAHPTQPKPSVSPGIPGPSKANPLGDRRRPCAEALGRGQRDRLDLRVRSPRDDGVDRPTQTGTGLTRGRVRLES